ncbi:MAG: 3-phosphoshikimate 1-carboxyvinyltransferase [Oscillospiraceae bacterium]|nr:3-phosphoshikimate 1-carboxyvinyltransferase [Oscillospiraceae bacterium]
MDVSLRGGARSGTVCAPASKSAAHRMLLCAALGERAAYVRCGALSRDVAATVECLRSLGAEIEAARPGELCVTPLRGTPKGVCVLPCAQSASTLRFLLPVAGSLGARAVFAREGSLSRRPVEPLLSVLRLHGMNIREDGEFLRCEGRLLAGSYEIDGGVSSQFATGLLFALTILGGSTLCLRGEVCSAPYLALTEDALALAGVPPMKQGFLYQTGASGRFQLPERVACEGDWSNAAPFLCMGALSEQGITVNGLRMDSRQGDRAVLELLCRCGARVETDGDAVTIRRGELHGFFFDAEQTPDLVPAAASFAACIEGETRIVHAARLRMKESDRLSSTAALLSALGAEVTVLADGMVIRGGGLRGGAADAAGDHRIAMAAAVAACGCAETVTLRGAECVEKSYPAFWEDVSCLSM